MQDKDFFITSIGGLRDVADIIVTRETFNNNIRLSDFGEGVKRISFHALTYDVGDALHDSLCLYDKEKKEIFGRLPLNYKNAATYAGQDAQRLVAEAFFDLFDKIKDQVKGFDFEGLKRAMLKAIETNPSFAPQSGFRVYSDYDIPTGDLPEFSKALRPTKYGKGVQKVFVKVGLFKNPSFRMKPRPRFDDDKKGLYMTIVSSLDLDQFKSELDKNIELIKPKVKDFDFELFKADLLHFAKGLRIAA